MPRSRFKHPVGQELYLTCPLDQSLAGKPGTVRGLLLDPHGPQYCLHFPNRQCMLVRPHEVTATRPLKGFEDLMDDVDTRSTCSTCSGDSGTRLDSQPPSLAEVSMLQRHSPTELREGLAELGNAVGGVRLQLEALARLRKAEASEEGRLDGESPRSPSSAEASPLRLLARPEAEGASLSQPYTTKLLRGCFAKSLLDCYAEGAEDMYRQSARVPSLTPLMRASSEGHSVSVRALLDARADLHLRDPDGMQALHFAARAGSAACCELLLSAGADANSSDDYWRNAFDFVPPEALQKPAVRAMWYALIHRQALPDHLFDVGLEKATVKDGLATERTGSTTAAGSESLSAFGGTSLGSDDDEAQLRLPPGAPLGELRVKSMPPSHVGMDADVYEMLYGEVAPRS